MTFRAIALDAARRARMSRVLIECCDFVDRQGEVAVAAGRGLSRQVGNCRCLMSLRVVAHVAHDSAAPNDHLVVIPTAGRSQLNDSLYTSPSQKSRKLGRKALLSSMLQSEGVAVEPAKRRITFNQ